MLQTQGLRKRVQYPARPLRGEWWGPQDPWAVLQARDIGPCAQGGGQRRLLPRQYQPRLSGSKRGGVGVGGIYHSRVRGARGEALRYAGPKYSWRKRWCVAIMFRSMEHKRGYLPSISSSPSGVRAGVAIRAGEGGPLSVSSAAGMFFTAVRTGGGGGVASRRIRLIGAVCRDRAEGVAEPLCAVGGATGRFQEVTEA